MTFFCALFVLLLFSLSLHFIHWETFELNVSKTKHQTHFSITNDVRIPVQTKKILMYKTTGFQNAIAR